MVRDAKYWVDEPVPETPAPSEYPAPWKKTKIVGTRMPRLDGYERVSGTAVYPSDIVLPGMLYGALGTISPQMGLLPGLLVEPGGRICEANVRRQRRGVSS